MEDLTSNEINEVSGGQVIKVIFSLTKTIAKALYYAGLNARESGNGDAFLEAVRGGNMGA